MNIKKYFLYPSLGFILCFLISTISAFSVEYLRDEEPAPDSVEGLESPLGRTFRLIYEKEVLFPGLRDLLKDYPPFIRDTLLDVNLRSFYLDRTNTDKSNNTAWALGGSISYKSGALFNLVSFGGEVFTSQRLYGPEDRDGTLLLGPGQEGFTVIGRAYGQIEYQNKVDIKLYRQYLDTPYVNKQDNRMVPNTFEAYILYSDLNVIKLGGGYISKIKRRGSDEFVSMSKIGGIENVDNGMYVFGLLFEPTEKFSIGGINYFVDDVINIFYSESYFVQTTKSGIGIKLSVQFTDQRSVGKDLLGSDFSTQVWGGQIAGSYLNTIARFAFSVTSNDRRIISPYGGYPGYLSLMKENFNRAGEKAFLLGVSHDFKYLDGLSFFTNYAFGYDAINSVNKSKLPDQKEFDITFDYQPKIKVARGLWLRLRYANVDITGERHTINELRLILNYNFPVL